MKGPLSTLFFEGKYLIQKFAHLLPKKSQRNFAYKYLVLEGGKKKSSSAHTIGWIKQFFLAQCCSI
jgi:hypothetical protein